METEIALPSFSTPEETKSTHITENPVHVSPDLERIESNATGFAFDSILLRSIQFSRDDHDLENNEVPAYWIDLLEDAGRRRLIHLQKLIENKAVKVYSISPLQEACKKGYNKWIEVLLKAGAQVDARNPNGNTPLCDACAVGSYESVKLLLDWGANVNPTQCTLSPLHKACMTGNPDCVQILIDNGANMELNDYHHGTPLHLAATKKVIECSKKLLIAGAKVNVTKRNGWTPLHHAAQKQNVCMIELLVHFGANLHAKDKFSKKAIDYTEPGTRGYLCIEHFERVTFSLMHISRMAVIAAFGTQAREAISKMGLPDCIVRFLTFQSHPLNEREMLF